MAATTIVMTLEGILAGRDDDVRLQSALVEPLGRAMYTSFASVARVVLLTKSDRRLADHWLASNGMTQHAAVYPLTDHAVPRLRASGETPDLYLDHHPERAAHALKDGCNTMLLAKPLISRSGFQRSDLPGLQRPFAAIMAEQGVQQEVRSRPVWDEDEERA